MKLIAQVKLQPTSKQAEALKDTIEATNAAANYISKRAWETHTFRQYDLHHMLYAEVRSTFRLSAQITVRVLAKVADAYKLDRRTQRMFNKRGSIAYDRRILSWQLADHTTSIWTVDRRQHIPFVAGQGHLKLLESLFGEADLVYRDGQFYLYQTCEVEEPPPGEVKEFLGIDLGIKNIAVDSDGELFAGGQTNGLRKRHAKVRAKLQSKGTKSARRLLQKRRKKESSFAKDVNHCIAKRLVEKAKDTGRGIALEDLKGIRGRVTVRKSQRRQHSSWAFADLRAKIEYKARLGGVPVVGVDPRNTSHSCPVCGCVDKLNRSNQAVFSCISCGFADHADIIAARNIASRATVNWPHVSALPGGVGQGQAVCFS